MTKYDYVAEISEVRHARQSVFTTSTDSLDFLQQVKVGDSISIEGFVTYVHNTSMEVFIKGIKEGLLTAEQSVCATAFLTFVAFGEDGQPAVVPKVYPETEQEKMLFEGAE